MKWWKNLDSFTKFDIKAWSVVLLLFIATMWGCISARHYLDYTRPRQIALAKPATLKNAKHELIKTYTNDKKLYYVYRLTWPYRNKVEYQKVTFIYTRLDTDSHTFKQTSVQTYQSEPIPDDVKKFKVVNVEQNDKLKKIAADEQKTNDEIDCRKTR